MKFLDIAKYFSAVGVIATAAILFDDAKDDIKDNQDDIIEMLEFVNAEQSIMSEDIQNIHDTLVKLEEEHKHQGEKIEDVVWILNHQNDYSPEQLEEIMDRLLKKNYVMEKEDLEWPEELTVRTNTDLKRGMYR